MNFKVATISKMPLSFPLINKLLGFMLACIKLNMTLNASEGVFLRRLSIFRHTPYSKL
jgi:hypothetical protein